MNLLDNLDNLDKLHTTELGIQRIKRNLSLDIQDIVPWCQAQISSSQAEISKKWKNFYVQTENYIFTINSYSRTIITAKIIK